ncbi:MAG: GMC family oxidoreductase [Spirochaetes bacterium]|nr:GMC family oxidoreductase [Spirochaetota bacterium]
MKEPKNQYDVIVVGTGAGGSTVAREMTRRGKKVLMLEKGGRTNMMGNTLTMAFILQRFGLMRSKEKYVVTFADNYGGLSNLTAGCASPPPEAVFGPVGIDLTEEREEARVEMKVQKLPDELVGKANLRLLEAANDAGYNWGKLENFIDPAKCRENCADCMLGCPTGAKFTARVYGDEAVEKGAELHLHTTVTDVIVENGRVRGVKGRRFGMPVAYLADQVVLSSGHSNVHILRRAGIEGAGRGFACDWLQFVGAIVPGISTSHANPMSVGTMEHYESDGIAIIPVFPNWSQFMVILGLMGPSYLPKFFNFWKYSGIMVKIRDETSGEVLKGSSFSKPVTKQDKMRLDKGVGIIRKVFKSAGAKEESIIALKPSGAHPSSSCRIGEVVDSNLETDIKNLYCCDASVFPSSLGLPVVWTAVSLGKRLAKHLEKKI